jgi:TRAP transporter TAXI family solute receptor
MNSKRFKFVLLFLLLSIIVFVSAGCGSQETNNGSTSNNTKENSSSNNANKDVLEIFNIGTASAKGSYYPLASAIGKKINDKLGYNVVAHISPSAHLESIERMRAGEWHAGMGSPMYWNWASKGIKDFEGQKPLGLRSWFAFQRSYVMLIADESKGIKTMKDLVGKRIATDINGTSVNWATRDLFLETHGLDPDKDVNLVLIDPTGAINALKDGNADVTIALRPAGNAQLTELALSKNVNMIDFGDEVFDRVKKDLGYFEIEDFSEGNGLFPDIKRVKPDQKILSYWAQFVVKEDIPEEMMYQMTKVIFENVEEFQALSKSYSEFTLENALKGSPVPLHPGAERYYREVGLLK